MRSPFSCGKDGACEGSNFLETRPDERVRLSDVGLLFAPAKSVLPMGREEFMSTSNSLRHSVAKNRKLALVVSVVRAKGDG